MRKLRRLMTATFQCLCLMISLLFLSSFAFSQTPAANPREENRLAESIGEVGGAQRAGLTGNSQPLQTGESL
jgi:hypothetical protein